MSVESSNFIIMSLVFLFSNIFWAATVNKILNKALSKNYVEYIQAENLKNRKKPEIKIQDQSPVDIERALDADRMMGIV